MDTLALHDAVRAVCPIDGLDIGNPADRATWVLHPAPSAEDAQKSAAQAVLDGWVQAPKAIRSATSSQLYAVMTDAQTSAWDKAVSASKLAYQAYWLGGYRDAMPETNPKLGKIAKAAGVDLKSLFDLVSATT